MGIRGHHMPEPLSQGQISGSVNEKSMKKWKK